jgi:hypothetical protein
MPLCRFADLPICRSADLPMCRSLDVSICHGVRAWISSFILRFNMLTISNCDFRDESVDRADCVPFVNCNLSNQFQNLYSNRLLLLIRRVSMNAVFTLSFYWTPVINFNHHKLVSKAEMLDSRRLSRDFHWFSLIFIDLNQKYFNLIWYNKHHCVHISEFHGCDDIHKNIFIVNISTFESFHLNSFTLIYIWLKWNFLVWTKKLEKGNNCLKSDSIENDFILIENILSFPNDDICHKYQDNR